MILLVRQERRRMKIKGKNIILCIAVVLALLFSQGHSFAANQAVNLQVDLPYSLGIAKQTVMPDEIFMMRITVFHPQTNRERVTVQIEVPQGVEFVDANEIWTHEEKQQEQIYQKEVEFSEGYGNWFDFLRFHVRAEGEYSFTIKVISEEKTIEVKKVLTVIKNLAATAGDLKISKIVVPFDEEGKYDDRMDQATLLLRDTTLDYYKNLFTGKGATNTAAERVHPVTNMLISVANPARQQKLLLLRAHLLDKKTGERIPGLISPRSTADEDNMELNEEYDKIHGLSAFIALDGEKEQKVRMPVYVDEAEIKSGEVILKVEGYDGENKIVEYAMPIKVIHRDETAAWITSVMFIFVLLLLPFILSKKRLKQMKSRWLITAALFGATAFAVVSLPTTFISDFFHIILGPFSFLITGMFSGILMYMLLCSLVILIPHMGIVSLMLFVKMLINMIVFGHISPISLLLVGVQAVLLEGFLCGMGITKKTTGERADLSAEKRIVCSLFLACGIADAISTYVNLQAMAFLHRLYYAQWYILLCTFISGFLYSGIGAVCGFYLGKELKKVGGD